MKILGIDPGYAILGYGIIDMNGNKFSVIDYGAVITDSKMDMPDRLKYIYFSLMEIIAEHKPDTASIEELFFNLSLIHISEPTRLGMISYAVFCLKKKKKKKQK